MPKKKHAQKLLMYMIKKILLYDYLEGFVTKTFVLFYVVIIELKPNIKMLKTSRSLHNIVKAYI